MQAHFTAVSENRKTGPIPVTITEQASCPSSCALRHNGCYAEGGPLFWAWSAISDRRIGVTWDQLCDHIARLPGGTLWRHNQAGDLPGLGSAIDGALLRSLVEANAGRRGFTFTHKPVLGGPEASANQRLIAQAVTDGFLINLSADTRRQADGLAELGIAPVVCVLPRAYGRRTTGRGGWGDWAETIAQFRDRIAPLPTHTPAGRRIAICPATYTDTTCRDCGACARLRAAVIGFPAHGWQVLRADAVATED
jgi:hypothetical protein